MIYLQKLSTTPDEAKKRAMYQLINKEQQYATALQFAVTRFVSALSERKDLITPQDHHLLFQNSEEVCKICLSFPKIIFWTHILLNH